MMTTVRAANSVTPSVASVPKRAAALQKVVHREEAAQEEVRQEVLLRETPAEVAVVPVVMRTIITRRAAVAEAVEDNGYV